jgi:hypothetical protein
MEQGRFVTPRWRRSQWPHCADVKSETHAHSSIGSDYNLSMVSQRIEKLLRKELERLSEPQQERVVEFARSLATLPPGAPGASLLRFAGAISPEDAAAMKRAIEAECERIDPNGW